MPSTEAKIRDLPKNLLEGVPSDIVVIDTGNYYPRERDGRIDGIEAGMPESRDSWRQQPGTPVYDHDSDSAGVRHALAEARKERTSQWRATGSSPGSFAQRA